MTLESSAGAGWAGALAAAAILASSTAAAAGPTAYHALGFTPQDVLTGTILNARVLPGEAKQVVCIATYFTGDSSEARAVNVRFGVFDRVGDELVQRYVRDFGAEQGGHVGNGDLNVFDLDDDGLGEIIVSFDSFANPLIEQRLGEVIFHDGAEFRTAWSGPFEYDATRAARTVPDERRDRFTREVDFAATLRTRGVTLFMNKTMIAVAGEPLPKSKTVRETFPLRPRSR